MAKYSFIQNNFMNGRLSKRFQYRSDLKEYFQGCEVFKNYISGPMGGARRRPGTQHRQSNYDSGDVRPTVLPFIYSNNDAYLISMIQYKGTYASSVMLNNFLIIDREGNGQYVYDAGIYISSPYNELALENLDSDGWTYAQSADILYITHKSSEVRPIIIIRDRIKAADLALLTPWSTGTPYSLGTIRTDGLSERAYRCVLAHTSSTDLLTDVKNGYWIEIFGFYINRLGGVLNTEYSTFDARLDPVKVPYMRDNISGELLLELSVSSGAGTLTAYDSGGALVLDFFKTHGVIGASYRVNSAGNSFLCTVTSTSGASSVNVYVLPLTYATPPAFPYRTDDWAESSFSNYRGWPKTVGFYNGRLTWASTKHEPDSLFFSQINNYEFFMGKKLNQDTSTDVSGLLFFGPISDDDPFQKTLGSRDVNGITFIVPQFNLLVGTFDDEYIVSGTEAIFSNANSKAVTKTSYGSLNIRPVTLGDSVYFVTSDGKTIREFRYNETNGSYIAASITSLSDDFIYEGLSEDASTEYNNARIKQLTIEKTRNIIWVLTTDGRLFSLKIDRETNGLLSMSQHELGDPTGAIVYSMTVIPKQNEREELWLLVYRPHRTTAKFSYEKLKPDFNHKTLNPDSIEDIPWYMDAAEIRKVTTPLVGTNFAGFNHLENQTVDVIIDGVHIGEYEVESSGILQLVTERTINNYMLVGFRYTSKLKTMPLEAGGQFGTSLGSLKRTDEIIIRFLNSSSIDFGWKDDDLFTITHETDLYTGNVKRIFPSGVNRDAQVVIETDSPFPVEISGIVAKGVTYD